MVIESKNQYKDLLNFIRGKDVAISLMRHDFRTHPAESSTTIASICCGSEHHDIIFDHSGSAPHFPANSFHSTVFMIPLFILFFPRCFPFSIR